MRQEVQITQIDCTAIYDQEKKVHILSILNKFCSQLLCSF